MALDIKFSLAIIQVLIQFLVVYIVYAIYREQKLDKAWLFIIIAFLIMAYRRINMPFISGVVGTYHPAYVEFIDTLILPVIVSSLLLIGFLLIKKKFRK